MEKIKYETAELQIRFKIFSGFTAQIIQHEIDHCAGILIKKVGKKITI